MDWKRVADQARLVINKRGGTESLKEDADELRDIAEGPGTLSDKAKRAAEAVREPGAHAEQGGETGGAGGEQAGASGREQGVGSAEAQTAGSAEQGGSGGYGDEQGHAESGGYGDEEPAGGKGSDEQ
jgi:hypothetical protein